MSSADLSWIMLVLLAFAFAVATASFIHFVIYRKKGKGES